MLRKSDIYKVINEYIGVQGGYLGDFSYRSHEEFYPQYCDLNGINIYKYDGTTRQKFLTILSESSSDVQAKILRGVLLKYPPTYFPIEVRVSKQKISEDILEMITRLERSGNVSNSTLAITSDVVARAISDAETLIQNGGATSGVDRIHTAMHGFLKALCDGQGISYEEGTSLTGLLKLLRRHHPKLLDLGPRSGDVNKVLNSASNIMDALNPIRNNASIAHPNEDLLHDPEAMLVINVSKSILSYLDSKLVS